MLWPLFIRDGRNRDGQRALDPCDPSSGHCMRRWLLSEGCVHGALDFLRHAAVLSADSNVRSPFLGSSQRRRRAGACERPRFAEGGKVSNCRCRERRICLSKSSCCHVQLRSFSLNSHVKNCDFLISHGVAQFQFCHQRCRNNAPLGFQRQAFDIFPS